jgi:hypothetical protein
MHLIMTDEDLKVRFTMEEHRIVPQILFKVTPVKRNHASAALLRNTITIDEQKAKRNSLRLKEYQERRERQKEEEELEFRVVEPV